jgi:hypothetical protein
MRKVPWGSTLPSSRHDLRLRAITVRLGARCPRCLSTWGIYDCPLRSYVLGVSRRRRRSWIARYWGYLVLVIAWVATALGFRSASSVVALVVASVLALAAFVYVLFQAPMPCGAPIRDTATMRRARETGLPGGELHCRNNSRGLLKGCRQVQQHKWQYLKTALIPARWLALLRQLASCWQGLTNIVVAAASAITVISTAALVTRHFA